MLPFPVGSFSGIFRRPFRPFCLLFPLFLHLHLPRSLFGRQLAATTFKLRRLLGQASLTLGSPFCRFLAIAFGIRLLLGFETRRFGRTLRGLGFDVPLVSFAFGPASLPLQGVSFLTRCGAPFLRRTQTVDGDSFSLTCRLLYFVFLLRLIFQSLASGTLGASVIKRE